MIKVSNANSTSNMDSNAANPQLEDLSVSYDALELWASQWDISDLELASPAQNENVIPTSLVPLPAPNDTRAHKSASAKKRRHNGIKGEECYEWFEHRYEAEHVANWKR